MSSPRIGNYRWAICALLFFATTVNYLDRQVLSLLAPDLSKEFGWSNTDYANIAAAFQFVYAISMLFAGRVVDRIGTRRAFMWAIAVWSAGAWMHAYSLPVGQFEAWYLSGTAVRLDKPTQKREVHVWISDDARRYPLKIHADLPVGSFDLVLREAR